MKPVKFDRIHVALDNSDHSNACAKLSIALSEATGATLVGSHVYAGKLHDVRFKQMEFTLPDEYKEETELEKQRRIHDALIVRGLQLISDSYLDVMAREAEKKGFTLERKLFDGRTFEPLVEDINTDDYDLLVIGALGQGAVKDSDIGSVCERLLRRTTVDTLVIRDADEDEFSGENAIVVAIDGSDWSMGALWAACGLAKKSQRPLELVATLEAGDPAKEMVEALLEKGLEIARGHEVEASSKIIEGSAPEALASYLEDTRAWAVAVGRHGLDTDPEGKLDIGSVTEHLARSSSAHVLISSRRWAPAEEASASKAA